ncbi:MAG: hypothetical protein ACSW8H_05570, partial [bacterium]
MSQGDRLSGTFAEYSDNVPLSLSPWDMKRKREPFGSLLRFMRGEIVDMTTAARARSTAWRWR